MRRGFFKSWPIIQYHWWNTKRASFPPFYSFIFSQPFSLSTLIFLSLAQLFFSSLYSSCSPSLSIFLYIVQHNFIPYDFLHVFFLPLFASSPYAFLLLSVLHFFYHLHIPSPLGKALLSARNSKVSQQIEQNFRLIIITRERKRGRQGEWQGNRSSKRGENWTVDGVLVRSLSKWRMMRVSAASFSSVNSCKYCVASALCLSP